MRVHNRLLVIVVAELSDFDPIICAEMATVATPTCAEDADSAKRGKPTVG